MQSTFIYLFTSTLTLSYPQLSQSSDVEKAGLTGRPVLTIVSDNRQIPCTVQLLNASTTACTVQLLNASTTALRHRIYISVISSFFKRKTLMGLLTSFLGVLPQSSPVRLLLEANNFRNVFVLFPQVVEVM